MVAAKRHAPWEDGHTRSLAASAECKSLERLAAEKRSKGYRHKGLSRYRKLMHLRCPRQANRLSIPAYPRAIHTAFRAKKGRTDTGTSLFYVALLANQNPAFLPHGNPIPKPCEQIGIAARFAHHAHKLIERFTVGGGAQHRSNRAQAFNFRFA